MHALGLCFKNHTRIIIYKFSINEYKRDVWNCDCLLDHIISIKKDKGNAFVMSEWNFFIEVF